MATCTGCDREMTLAASCDPWPGAVPFGQELANELWRDTLPERCRDCGIRQGGVHHLGCCIEICGTCHNQMLQCECDDDDDQDDDPEPDPTPGDRVLVAV